MPQPQPTTKMTAADPRRVPTTLEVLRLIRDSRLLKDPDRRVLEAIVLRGDHRRQFFCYPSHAQIAVECRIDRRTVKRCIARLREDSLLNVVSRSNKSNHFFVNVEAIEASLASFQERMRIEEENAVRASEEEREYDEQETLRILRPYEEYEDEREPTEGPRIYIEDEIA